MIGTLLLCALAALAPTRAADDPVAALASPHPARARAAADALRRLGDEGERRLWEDFAAAPPAARRSRARWALESAGRVSVAPAAAALGDPDEAVRAALARFLGRVEGTDAALDALRVGALAARARVEQAPDVRAALGEALAAVGGDDAARELVALLAEWPAPDRLELARRLIDLPAARGRVAPLVARAFTGPDGVALPDDVLGLLLPTYARALADAPTPDDTPRARAPLLLGLRHPAPEVRAGAEVALDLLLTRLRALGRTERADRLLAALAREGPDPREAHHRRALHALQTGLDPALAVDAARELDRLARLEAGLEPRLWRFRAAYLEAAAAIADGAPQAAAAPAARARGLVEGLLAERADLATEAGRGRQHDLMHQRALLELLEALRLVAEGRGGADGAVVERARRVHELELEAQLFAVEADLPELNYLDALFEAGTSPVRLVLAREPGGAWPVERQLRAERELGRALQAVAPREVIGFERLEVDLGERADPLVDPPRRGLLEAVLQARVRAAEREYRKALGRLTERAFRGEVIEARDEERLALLDFARRQRQVEVDDGPAESYASLRGLSYAGLRYARALRDEGRTEECRDVGRRMLDEIERRQLAQQFTWGLELAAEVRIVTGSAWTAEGDGLAAQRELELAVEALEALEAQLVERGAPLRAAAARDSRAGALVSLAVNANVKLEDPVRALAYFERAYALRQDDFMRVLLACYRARSGRADEARALVADVPVAAPYYYNLACTFALLGERERALELLARELAENHPSEGSLRQQRTWARADPDLAALRGDPRFVELVGSDDEPPGPGPDGGGGR